MKILLFLWMALAALFLTVMLFLEISGLTTPAQTTPKAVNVALLCMDVLLGYGGVLLFKHLWPRRSVGGLPANSAAAVAHAAPGEKRGFFQRMREDRAQGRSQAGLEGDQPCRSVRRLYGRSL